MGRGYDSGPALTQYWLDDSFPRRGGGTVMSHSKGGYPKGGEGGSTNHSQGEGVGGWAEYVIVFPKYILVSQPVPPKSTQVYTES